MYILQNDSRDEPLMRKRPRHDVSKIETHFCIIIFFLFFTLKTNCNFLFLTAKKLNNNKKIIPSQKKPLNFPFKIHNSLENKNTIP